MKFGRSHSGNSCKRFRISPHFISTVIIIGMIKEFTSLDGLFNSITGLFGMEPVNYLAEPSYFRTLFVGSGIWQGIGWGTILYLAALSNADPTLYDVASIDGANRWQKTKHISIPTILPTTIILFILSVGGILGTDFMMVLLMYNPSTYDKADVIGTYVYRIGLEGGRFEYAAAVGLMLSVVSFLFVLITNRLITRAESDFSRGLPKLPDERKKLNTVIK